MKTYLLWHPDSPGVKVFVRCPALLRRLGIIRSCFATLGETANKHNGIFCYPITEHAPQPDVDRTRGYFRRYS